MQIPVKNGWPVCLDPAADAAASSVTFNFILTQGQAGLSKAKFCSTTFYRSDVLPVTQPKMSKH